MPPFLKLDISGVPTLIGTFMFGPAAGIFITLVKDLIHLLSSQTGGVGELSDFLIYAAFSLSAGLLYRYHKSKKRGAGGLFNRNGGRHGHRRAYQQVSDHPVLLQTHAD